jgi:integrase
MNETEALQLYQHCLKKTGHTNQTSNIYLRWLKKFIQFLKNNESPADQWSPRQKIQKFLASKYTTHHYASSTINQAISAIVLFYRELQNEHIDTRRLWAKTPDHLPETISKEDVLTLIDVLPLPYSLITMLFYGSGLSVSECLNLQEEHIDLQNVSLVVKQHCPILSHRAIPLIKQQIKRNQELRAKKHLESPHWLFPSKSKPDQPMSPVAWKRALKQARTSPLITAQSLRQNFILEMLRRGYSLPELQNWTGLSVETLLKYQRAVLPKGTKSPLDTGS